VLRYRPVFFPDPGASSFPPPLPADLSDPRNIIGSCFQRKIKYFYWNSLEFPSDIGIIRTVGTNMTADARCTPDLQWITPPRRQLWGIVTDRG
jgi:hypothetical protein